MRSRKPIRLEGRDYSLDGYYFVTVCMQQQGDILSHIDDGRIILNDAGNMVDFWWQQTANHFACVKLDEYIIMPDHIHGIIIIDRPCPVGEGRCALPLTDVIQQIYTKCKNK